MDVAFCDRYHRWLGESGRVQLPAGMEGIDQCGTRRCLHPGIWGARLFGQVLDAHLVQLQCISRC